LGVGRVLVRRGGWAVAVGVRLHGVATISAVVLRRGRAVAVVLVRLDHAGTIGDSALGRGRPIGVGVGLHRIGIVGGMRCTFGGGRVLRRRWAVRSNSGRGTIGFVDGVSARRRGVPDAVAISRLGGAVRGGADCFGGALGHWAGIGGGYDTTALEYTRLGCGGDNRLAGVHFHVLRGIRFRRGFVLHLQGGGLNVPFASGRLLGCSGLRSDATGAAIVADVVHGGGVVDYGLVVSVVDDGGVHVGHGAVVVEDPAIPVAAVVAVAAVTVAVVYAAVEADVLTPVAGVEGIDIAAPTPIARSPEIARTRR